MPQLACQRLANELYLDPEVQARYPNGVESMFKLDAFMQTAPISVGAGAMQSKLEFLLAFQIKNLQHISNIQPYLGPAPAAAPTAAPAAAAAAAACSCSR